MVSIDRLNSNLGYTIDNICLASWEINRMKSDIDYDRFVSICDTISNNLKNA
jgi:hypothetical protein